MEHRQYSRIPLDVRTLIFRRGLPVATGRVRNASRLGLFVETHYDDLFRHQKLECEVCLRPESGMAVRRERLCAHVSRREGSGVGLELDEDEHTLHAVLDLMQLADKLRMARCA